MKIHRPLIEALVSAWHDTMIEGRHAEKVLERLFKANRKFGARDRRFVAENFYNGVRWWRPLVEERKGHWRDEGNDLTSADLYAMADQLLALGDADLASAFAQGSRAQAQSIPDWLDAWGERELGDAWEPTLKALNRPAPVYLRVNGLKASLPEVQTALQEEGILTDPVPEVATALRLRERKNVFQTRPFQQGWFEMQDAGSQLIAPFLEPRPKSRVIDACAGAGGKSLHLAALMKNTGRIIAMDVHEWKLKALRERAARSGVDTIETCLITSTKQIKRHDSSADALLLDVPCSGLGVLRRHPDSKWKLTAASLEQLAVTQNEILQNYTRMVKPGGKVVFATCSLLPSENDQRVRGFLEKHPEFKLEAELKVSPIETDFDGFYAARLIRVLN